MSRLSQVLLFDSDTKGREILAYGFEGDAVSARVANTVAEALELAGQANPPDVVIAVWRTTEDDTWDLLRRFSADETLRAIPRLALAAASDLPAELRELPGSTSFLPLPAFVRDVVTAARLLVSSAPAPGQTEPQLVGTLSEYGLLFLVRTMVGLRRSGIIAVERAHRRGEVRFHEGELVGASVGTLQGQPALHQLLLWEEGALDVRLRSVSQRSGSLPQGEHLLDDLDRFLRDFEHATKNIGHAQSLYIQDTEKTASLVDSIPAEVLPVMKLFDGHRSLGDVLEDSPFLAFDTLKIIGRLVEMGTIRRKAIEKPSAGLGGPRRPRIDEWVQRRGDAPAVRAAPAPVPNGNTSAGSSERGHRRRSRRRTGEVPTTDLVARTEAAVEEVSSPAPELPPELPRELPRELAPVVEIAAKERPKAGELAATGELRAERRDRPNTPIPDNVPKVVVDLGPVDPAAAETEAVPAPVPEQFMAGGGAGVPAIPASTTGALPDPAAPEQRLSGIRSAEIDTGRRPAPTPESLSTPGEGPSIMLDPHLVAEMDAFELANAPATPPPTVTAPPPPAAVAPPPAAPRPQQPPAAAPASVVSFVHGVPSLNPHAALNAAPTVPVVPVGRPHAAAAPPGGPGATPPPAAGAPPPGGEAGAAGRRASGEFNALEADFFARESDLYQADAAETFDDLDPVTRQRRGGPDRR